MTQDEIIEMAKQANVIHPEQVYVILEAFANLVEARATEKANARANASWTLMCEKMVAAEREACAKLCESRLERWVKNIGKDKMYKWMQGLPDLIRRRGEQA